jgi:hypothetical protein
MTEYASALLSQIPCMRMKEVGSRRTLTEQPNLRGIIYNTVKFCDYYSFEYAELAGRTNLPVLKIETDYTSVTEGQLVTRLEAFAEEFAQRTDTLSSENAVRTSSSSEPEKETDGAPFEEFFVGVDSGSTTTISWHSTEPEKSALQLSCVPAQRPRCSGKSARRNQAPARVLPKNGPKCQFRGPGHGTWHFGPHLRNRLRA